MAGGQRRRGAKAPAGRRIIGATVTLVLDTNVWLDWLVFGDPRIGPLADAIDAGTHTVLATGPMLAEFGAVVARPQFGLDAAAASALEARQRATVLLCEAAPDCRLPCTDRADQMFIDLAVARRVDWLLSRDKALLRLRRIGVRRFGLRVGTPEHWLLATAGDARPAYNRQNDHTAP
jgi:predicted nucleic acid-binding protein